MSTRQQAVDNPAQLELACVVMNSVTKKAIDRAGGPSAVSRALGLTKQAVSKWIEVPPRHVLALERLTGISRHVLRPDIYGPSSSERADGAAA